MKYIFLLTCDQRLLYHLICDQVEAPAMTLLESLKVKHYFKKENIPEALILILLTYL